LNKSALKTFAINARKELLERVELQARKIGITKDSVETASVESSDAIFINGKPLTDVERRQRNKLINRIDEIGFDQVMEETAYTWFNRFIALRFMEVNDYLPTRVRVLSSEAEDSTEPDMMKEALSLDLPIDKEYVYDLRIENKSDELFKYLIKIHCNDLNRYMPFMFETVEDYKDILFPEGLLGKDSFVQELIHTEIIPEEDWEEVEIIGWLYQYYIAEEKENVYAGLKKNIKINQDTLPAATQLFTPNWIVRYMVENSLGRIWLESYPDSQLRSKWEYYLDEADQCEKSIDELEQIRYKNVDIEKITFMDPACGSGHILVYAFDVFYDLYLEKGYIESEIPKLILENNLYGIDVDERAAQLASFAVMMKAREKSRLIFKKRPKLNIMDIQDSNWLTDSMIERISSDNEAVKDTLVSIKEKFTNAKELGTLISVEGINYDKLKESYEEYINMEFNLFDQNDQEKVKNNLPKLLNQLKLLGNKYDVVCTNPPYMGRNNLNKNIKNFIDKEFPNSKSDLFASFIERGFKLTKNNGFNTMVTMQSWMFLSSFEKMRKKILETKTITTLLHMENMVMGIAFGTSATVFRNNNILNYKAQFTEVKYNDIDNNGLPLDFPIKENRQGVKSKEDFSKIPGNPIGYWASKNLIKNFEVADKMIDIVNPKQGLATADNNRFLRQWYEVEYKDINFNIENIEECKNEITKWVPYNKGGERRQWYGNYDYIVNWKNDGEEIRNFKDDSGASSNIASSICWA
jgi:type II restriction/modification system DNA methylase subunit YeeA